MSRAAGLRKQATTLPRLHSGAPSGEAPTFDLQSHSQHSDGELSPHDVVAAAAVSGVQILALSDHDTVDGVSEASTTAQELGLRLVPAVEISAIFDGDQDL